MRSSKRKVRFSNGTSQGSSQPESSSSQASSRVHGENGEGSDIQYEDDMFTSEINDVMSGEEGGHSDNNDGGDRLTPADLGAAYFTSGPRSKTKNPFSSKLSKPTPRARRSPFKSDIDSSTTSPSSRTMSKSSQAAITGIAASDNACQALTKGRGRRCNNPIVQGRTCGMEAHLRQEIEGKLDQQAGWRERARLTAQAASMNRMDDGQAPVDGVKSTPHREDVPMWVLERAIQQCRMHDEGLNGLEAWVKSYVRLGNEVENEEDGVEVADNDVKEDAYEFADDEDEYSMSGARDGGAASTE